MYYTHPSYRTSIFGKNCAYYIRIFTVIFLVPATHVVMEKRQLNGCLSTLTLLHVTVTAYRLWKHSSSNSQTIPRRLHTD